MHSPATKTCLYNKEMDAKILQNGRKPPNSKAMRLSRGYTWVCEGRFSFVVGRHKKRKSAILQISSKNCLIIFFTNGRSCFLQPLNCFCYASSAFRLASSFSSSSAISAGSISPNCAKYFLIPVSVSSTS